MSINTVLVPVINQRGERVPTVVPINRIIDANQTLDNDVWLTYYGDKDLRKCRIDMTAAEFDDACNGLKRLQGYENKYSEVTEAQEAGENNG